MFKGSSRVCLFGCFGAKLRLSSDGGQRYGTIGRPGQAVGASGGELPTTRAADASPATVPSGTVRGASAKPLVDGQGKSSVSAQLQGGDGPGDPQQGDCAPAEAGLHPGLEAPPQQGEVQPAMPSAAAQKQPQQHPAQEQDPQLQPASVWREVDELDPRIRIPFREITLHKVIGKGTFKTVYRGSWNNTHVAVVAMRRGGSVTEARLLQRLSIHPNLVQLYRWCTDDAGNEYLVMELLQLGSLDAVLRSIGRQLLTQTKMTLVEQVVSACVELSREGLVHRDLAARNLLVKSLEPPHIKLADFGLARPAFPGAPAAGPHAPSGWMGPTIPAPEPAPRAVAAADAHEGQQPPPQPQPAAPQAPPRPASPYGNIVPARWAAPEVLSGAQPSEAGDVWSFGVTCWEIFANGAEPYATLTNGQVFLAVQSGYRLDRPRGCPLELWELVLQCWSEVPTARPRFDAIAQTLRGWREAYVQQQNAQPNASPQGTAFDTFNRAGAAGGGSAPAGAAADASDQMPAESFSPNLGGGRRWRPMPTVGVLSAGVSDARRARHGIGGGRDYRSQAPAAMGGGGASYGMAGSGAGASTRGSGSGGFGALVAGCAHGLLNTHMSFDVNDPPITPDYTSGSSIGHASIGVSREHLYHLAAAIGAAAIGRTTVPPAELLPAAPAGRQGIFWVSADSGARQASMPTSGFQKRAATAGGMGMMPGGGSPRTGSGMHGKIANSAEGVPAPTTQRQQNSGGMRTGARRSAGCGGGGGGGGGSLDARQDKPHRLRRPSSSLTEIAHGMRQAGATQSPRQGPAATTAPNAAAASRGSPSADSTLRQPSANSQPQAVGGSLSSGQAPSTITCASIFNETVGRGLPSNPSNASGGGATGSTGSGGAAGSTGSGGAAGINVSASCSGLSSSVQRSGAPPVVGSPWAHGHPAGANSWRPHSQRPGLPLSGHGLVPAAGPRGIPPMRAAAPQRLGGLSSPYIRIGELAGTPLPVAAWVAGQAMALSARGGQAAAGQPMPYAIDMDAPSSRRLAAVAAGNPFAGPTHVLCDDLSLSGMVKVTAAVLRGGANAEASSSSGHAGGMGSGANTSTVPASLVLPVGMTLTHSTRGSDAHDESTSAQVSEHQNDVFAEVGSPQMWLSNVVGLPGIQEAAPLDELASSHGLLAAGQADQPGFAMGLEVSSNNPSDPGEIFSSQTSTATGSPSLPSVGSGVLPHPQLQQLPQPQQAQQAQQRLNLLLGVSRTRRGSNGNRASGSVRCGLPADRSSQHGSAAGSASSSRNGGAVSGVRYRLIRTDPALEMGSPSGASDGRVDANASPINSLHSGQIAGSLRSAWSARSGWTPLPSGSAERPASEQGPRGGTSGLRWPHADPSASHSRSAGPSPGLSTTALLHAALAFSVAAAAGASGRAVAGVSSGGGGPRASNTEAPSASVSQPLHPVNQLFEDLHLRRGSVYQELQASTGVADALVSPGGAVTACSNAELQGSHDAPSVGPAPAAAVVGFRAVAHPLGAARTRARMLASPAAEGRSGLDGMDMLQARHMMDVLQELPESGSDGLDCPSPSEQTESRPQAHRTLLVARGLDNYEAGPYVPYRAGSSMPANTAGQVRRVLLMPGWDEQGAAAAAAAVVAAAQQSEAAGACCRNSDSRALSESFIFSTSDAVAAERQAIYEYLQVQQQRQERDW